MAFVTVRRTRKEMKRDEVKISALILAAKMWEDGSLNVEKPSEYELNCCMTYLQNLKHWDFENEDVQSYLALLIRYNIGNHFNKVASHRRWLLFAYELLLLANVPDLHEGLHERINSHDLSKYGPGEALGYSIMFGLSNEMRTLEGFEKEEWMNAVNNHYAVNPHHPQHYQSDRLSKMNTLDLQESLIDMLACRIERVLSGFPAIAIQALLDFPLYLYERYTETDRNFISETQVKWLGPIHDLISYPTLEQAQPLLDWVKKTGLKMNCQICDRDY